MAPQVLALWVNAVGFAPPSVIPVIVSAAVPVLESVRVCAALVVATFWLPKASVAGVSVANGTGAAVPVPVSATVCGDPLTLSATLIVAAKFAAEAGVKVTERLQLAPAASVLEQPLVRVKSAAFAPPSVTALIVSGAVPGLERTVVSAAEVTPTVVLGKLSVAGVRTACAAVPAPLSATVCGEPVTLSATESVAEKLATDAGVKITEIVQLPATASVLPQVFAEMAKSAAPVPVMPMLLIVNAAVPGLLSVTVCAAEVVLTPWLPKANEPGLRFTCGAVPVPVSATVCGEPVTLSATDNVALKLAADAGVNVTEMVQLPAAASELPQVFAEMAKSAGFVPARVTLLIVSAAVPGLLSVTTWAADVVLTG